MIYYDVDCEGWLDDEDDDFYEEMPASEVSNMNETFDSVEDFEDKYFPGDF